MALPDDLIEVKGVARLWGCHVSCVYRQILRQRLRAYRVAGRWRVSRADALAAVKVTGPGEGGADRRAEAEGHGRRYVPTHAEAVAQLRRDGYL